MVEQFQPLSAAERGRLRPTVVVDALEQFLARLPPDERRAAVLTFTSVVTVEDVRSLLRELGEPEQVEEFDRSLAEPPPRGETRRSVAPGAVSFDVIPTDNFFIQLEPPKDQELRALWAAIEPGFTDQSAPESGVG